MTSKAPRRIHVFFCGLFMDADALRAKGVQPVNPRRGCVSGFTLRIGQRATLLPDPDARVYGVLMDLSHDEIERLYAEPGVGMYRAEAVVVELDDAVHQRGVCTEAARARPSCGVACELYQEHRVRPARQGTEERNQLTGGSPC